MEFLVLRASDYCAWVSLTAAFDTVDLLQEVLLRGAVMKLATTRAKSAYVRSIRFIATASAFQRARFFMRRPRRII